MAYTAAVIGTGPDPDNPSNDGFAMGYQHADGYLHHDDVTLAACADIVPENATAFAERYDLGDAVYEDYSRMLEAEEPDIVSVTVPPAAHADIVVDCAESGIPDAVHCEKPMALTWSGAREMAATAADADLQLTFNHQRRFGEPFERAKALLDAGEIGDLERIEFGVGNLYDYGSHQFDLAGYFADQSDPAWVLAGLDYREETIMFGAHNENQATAIWEYDNGVNGFLSTGATHSVVDCHNRLIGTAGEIVIGDEHRDSPLAVRRDGEGWEPIDTNGDGIHDTVADRPDYVTRGVAEVVEALDEDRPSSLGASNALQATALIFGAYESVRSRGRIDSPMELDVDDNPLSAMVETGALNPVAADD